jgi:hypothetical protein
MSRSGGVRLVGACVLGAATIVSAQVQSPPIAKGPNLLVGRVLDIGSEAPIGGAIVTLTAQTVERSEAARQGIQLPARSVMTTSNGDFFFRELPAGKYSISVAAFGYVVADYPVKIVEIADSAKPASMTLRLWKHASISGRVTDERGEPVAGVPVSALQRVTVGSAIVLRRQWNDVETDDRGEYRIAGLGPGSYAIGVQSSSTSIPAPLAAEFDAASGNASATFRVRTRINSGVADVSTGAGVRLDDVILQRPGPAPALSKDGRVLAYSTTFFPGAATPKDATIITLASGESRTGVDVSIRFAPTVRVSGIASGPAGPIADLGVDLHPAFAVAGAEYEAIGVATAVTDHQGRFTFLTVAPGSYMVKSTLFPRTPDNSRGTPIWATQALSVSETDITGLAVTLKPGVRISGRVEFTRSAGPPPSASERLSLVLRPIAATAWSASEAPVRPDATFTSGGDRPGRYEVYGASASGWRVIGVTRGGEAFPDYTIELGADDLTDLVVTMSKTPSRLSGTVLGVQDARDPDASVIIFPADTTVWREGILQSRRVQRAHASAAGAFEITLLPPGEYYVTAVNARLALEWQDPQFLERLIAGATKVSLADADDKVVTLRMFTPRTR